MARAFGRWGAVFSANLWLATAVAASAIPRQLLDAIADAASECNGRVVQEKGFLTRRDINGDGTEYFIMNYLYFPCYRNHVRSLDWCGSAGCRYQILIGTKGAYRLTEIDNAIGDLKFSEAHGQRYLTFYVKEGPSAQKVTWRWDGHEYR